MSDVVFKVDNPPQVFHGHKVVLGAGSKAFEAMFFGNMPEGAEIRVPDVTAAGFVIMLRYLYTDMITIENESEAFEAAYASKKYLIRSLFRSCESYLLENVTLNSQTVFSIYEEASFLEMRKLQEHCMRYISRNAKKIFRSKSFIGASKSTLQDVLELELMNIDSEKEVIEALWLWGEQRCKEFDVECSVGNIRGFTKDLLKYVRFLTMTMEDLENILAKFQLLDTSEQITVLWNLAMPKPLKHVKMPEEFCEISRTRSISNCSRIKMPTEYRYSGSMSTFPVEKCEQKVQIKVTGSQIAIIGVVVAVRPIPCYSSAHRRLDFELEISNSTTNFQSKAKLCLKAEEQSDKCQLEQELVLDNYVVVSEEDNSVLRVFISGEGVRMMQSTEEEFFREVNKSCVSFRFIEENQDRMLFPVKEIMCV